jgi:hypothetical protein
VDDIQVLVLSRTFPASVNKYSPNQRKGTVLENISDSNTNAKNFSPDVYLIAYIKTRAHSSTDWNEAAASRT